MELLIFVPVITALVWGLPRLLLTVVLCVTAFTSPNAHKRLLQALRLVTRRDPPAK